MAEDKKSFVAYADWITSFEMLSDEEAGKLIKHLLNYVNDNDPILEERILQLAFEQIKLQLKRDLKKYEETKLRRSESGKLGGRPPADKAKKANALFDKQKKQIKANKAVNDNDNVNDNVTDTTVVVIEPPPQNPILVSYTLTKTNIENLSLAEKDSEFNARCFRMGIKTTDEVLNVLAKFNRHRGSLGKQQDSVSEYRQHFFNWITKGGHLKPESIQSDGKTLTAGAQRLKDALTSKT